MKKLVLSLLLSSIAVNAFGMKNDPEAAMKTVTYAICGAAAVGIASYYASEMWNEYLAYKYKDKQAQSALTVFVSI